MEVRPSYRQTVAGKLPEDWDVRPLETITDPSRPISYGIVQTGRRLRSGIPCVRVVDIDNGRVRADDLIKTSPEITLHRSRSTGSEEMIKGSSQSSLCRFTEVE